MPGTSKNPQDITLAIRVFDCQACQGDPRFHGVLRPGDSLEGQVEITFAVPRKIQAAVIRLEGVQTASVTVATTDDLVHAKLESNKQFLDIPHILSMEPHEGTQQSTIKLPFRFVIPEVSAFSGSSQPSSLQQLPPSFSVSNAYFKRWATTPPPRAAICYWLRCTVTLDPKPGDKSGQDLVHAAKALLVLPYFDPQPPAFVPDSETSQYVLRLERSVHKRFLGRRIGTLRASTEEPAPLAYSSDAGAPSTSCVIRFSLSGARIDAKLVERISLQVTTVLQAKTFYSVEALPHMPETAALTNQGLLRCYDDAVKVGKVKFPQLKWVYVADGDLTEDYGPSSAATLSAGTGGSWAACIHFQVSSPQALLPSFHTTLVARSYSLLCGIRVGGAYVEMVDLQVPLQVAYPRMSTLAPYAPAQVDSSSCLGRVALCNQPSELPKYDEISRR